MSLRPHAGEIPKLLFEALDSTNAEAGRRIAAGERGPLWICAARQTAGRGRRGRSWDTGPGNLAATLLMSLDVPAAEAAMLSFVAALAVFDLVQDDVEDGAVTLKWPNDVLVAGLKVSGILIESGVRPEGGLWVAVGVGVNLASPPASADRPATAIADHLRKGLAAPPSPAQALDRLAAAFERWRTAWDEQGAAAVLSAWSRRAEGLGRPCEVRLAGETLEGVAEGLDEAGALRLRLADGAIRRITAGDVFFPAPRPPGEA